ncbi:MAG: carboxypeptidase regulatory-like domain-containing protein [Candidatus Acidiferrales bacterium]
MVRADYLGRVLCVFACLLALAFLVPLNSFSQQVAIAQVGGQLTDPSGAAVPSATVKMIETERGVSHDTTSDADGRYILPGLPVGPYRLEVSKTGFKTYVQSGIVLQVNDHITLNVSLQLGAVSESVVVSSGATMLQTESAAVSNVVDTSRISELPLNGRFATQLVLLAGGAVMAQDPGGSPTGGTALVGDVAGSKSFYSSFAISVAGGQMNSTGYLLDGGDNNDAYSFTNLPFPFPDALAEFSVETSALPANMGLKSGGIVNIVTKSGTNAIHGDLFEFLRNGVFNARPHPYKGGPQPGSVLATNCIQPSGVTSATSAGAITGNPCDVLHRNQFGGTAGGKLIKDKVFWFMGYQGTRISQVSTTTTREPTADEISSGDFAPYFNDLVTSTNTHGNPTDYWANSPNCSGTFTKATSALYNTTGNKSGNTAIFGPGGTSGDIQDWLQAPYRVGGVMTGAPLWDPAATAIFTNTTANVPLGPGQGTNPSAANYNPCGFMQYPNPQVQNEDDVIGKMDWVVSPKHSLFGRYFVDNFTDPPPFQLETAPNLLVTGTPGVFQRAQSFTFGDTYTITPTAINSLHVTWNRRRDNRSAGLTINGNSLGYTSYEQTSNFLQISGPFTVGCGTCNFGFFNTNGIQEADDVDIIHGRHHFNFGVDVLRSQVNTLTNYENDETFTYGSSWTNNNLTDYLLGLYSGQSQSRPQQVTYRGTFPAVYFQDTIRVSNSITVNAGVRWEPQLFPSDVYGRGASFNLGNYLANLRSPSYASSCTSAALAADPNACPPAGMSFYGDPGVSKAFTADKLLLLDPRIGITWSPGGSQKQVVRIGAGIFRDATAAWYGQRMTSDPPGIDEIDLTQSFSSLASGGFCGTTSNPWEYYTPGGCVGATGSTPTPTQLAYKGPFPSINDFPASALWVVIPPNMKPTYVAQWTLSYQAQLWKDWMMSVTYVGNKSTHMPFGYSYNFSETPLSNIGAGNLCSLPSATATGVVCTSGNEPQRAYLNVLAGGATTTYNSSGVATGITPSTGLIGCAQATLTCKVATNLGYNELSTGMEMGTDSNNSNYNGLLATVQHRFGQGFTLNANYTYSHCFDDVEPQNDLNGVSGYVEQTNWALNYGPCGFDTRHVFNTSIVASSPVNGHNWKGWILGGWELAPNLRVVSGLPVNPLQGDNGLTGGNTNGSFFAFAPGYGIKNVYANALNSGYQYYNQAPFYITACTTAACTATTTLNPAYAVTANCSAVAPATCTVNGTVYASGALLPIPISASTYGGSGQFGSISRNLLRAPGAFSLDVEVSRMFEIHESIQLEFRFEAFNILNHWNPLAPATGGLTSGTSGSTFGYITNATLSGIIPSQYDPRVLQFALKLHW